MAILSRVIFSIILVLLLAGYQQVSSTISLVDFLAWFDAAALTHALSGINTVTISLVVILLLGIFSFTRILEAVWNVIFCASIIALLFFGSYSLLGPGIALPHAISNSEVIKQVCDALLAYQVPLACTTLVFIAGWICASACVRVALTTTISYALWYALSEFFSYIVGLWSSSDAPAAPEALNMVLGTPWVIAAVPGAFFLIYALLMSFFETFITTKQKKSKPTEAPVQDKPETPAESKAAEAAPKATEAAPVEPKLKSKPITEPRQKTLRLATGEPATPKKLKTAASEAKATEEKAAETKEDKPQEKPAGTTPETTDTKPEAETATPEARTAEPEVPAPAEAPAEKPAEEPAPKDC